MTFSFMSRLVPGLIRFVSAFIILSVTSLSSHAGVFRPIDGSYKLVFVDHFNGETLDTTKWTANWLGCRTCITHPVQKSNELAAYDPAQVKVLNGTLRLSMISKPVTIDGKTYPYRSGMVQTHGKAHFTYGYFEARIYLPISSGTTNKIANWPAWWTNGERWPETGENDIMEGLGDGVACYHFHSAVAPYDAPGGCPKGNFTGWHTYGALWEPGKVTYYYDGIKVGTITLGITSSPMYLILYYGASLRHGGPIRVPATMRVAYVMVFAKR